MGEIAACSKLNPLASSFVPSSIQKANSSRNDAVKLFKDLIQNKQARGEQALYRHEVSSLVRKLIFKRYKVCDESHAVIVENYLGTNIPRCIILKDLRSEATLALHKFEDYLMNRKSFIKSSLLSAFWGMYCYNQPTHPLLSLTYRPRGFSDCVWSFTNKDKKLWNPHCVETPCTCPPVFGYIVPPSFFGNPFHIGYSCKIHDVHLNHYAAKVNGNELDVLGCNEKYVGDEGFVDTEDNGYLESDLEYYAKHMKQIVRSVCEMLVADDDKDARSACELEKDESQDKWISDADSGLSSCVDIEEDNNLHPLLSSDDEDIPDEEGVSSEAREILRRSLSSESTAIGPAGDKSEVESCKVSANISDSDSIAANRLPTDEMDHIPVSYSNRVGNSTFPKTAYARRSLSVNDGDSRQMFGHIVLPESQDWVSSCADMKGSKSCSWGDSGFSSPAYSEDDVSTDARSPLWGVFSGDNSLWKALPPCSKLQPQRRMKDFRRQNSVN